MGSDEEKKKISMYRFIPSTRIYSIFIHRQNYSLVLKESLTRDN
jgi:hypothetical protein